MEVMGYISECLYKQGMMKHPFRDTCSHCRQTLTLAIIDFYWCNPQLPCLIQYFHALNIYSYI